MLSSFHTLVKMKDKTYYHIYALRFFLLTYKPFSRDNYLNSDSFMEIIKSCLIIKRGNIRMRKTDRN